VNVRTQLNTAWQGMDLVLLRDTEVVDRVAAADIKRVIIVSEGAGDSPGDLAYVLIETPQDVVMLAAETGIAGRVHFERQAFWAEQRCVYWVSASRVSLPPALRPRLWPLRRHAPSHARVPRSELGAAFDAWPLEGPQTWDERKWQRIARSRLLAPLDQAPRLGGRPERASSRVQQRR
jgi:hypothetical protein